MKSKAEYKGQISSGAGLVDRLWYLYDQGSTDLVRGRFLNDYPFRLTDLPREHKIRGTDDQALVLPLLPLTLRLVYQGDSHHLQALQTLFRKYGLAEVFGYLRAVILEHTNLVNQFTWREDLPNQDNANRFIAFIRKTLHPSKLRVLTLQDEADHLSLDELLEQTEEGTVYGSFVVQNFSTSDQPEHDRIDFTDTWETLLEKVPHEEKEHLFDVFCSASDLPPHPDCRVVFPKHRLRQRVRQHFLASGYFPDVPTKSNGREQKLGARHRLYLTDKQQKQYVNRSHLLSPTSQKIIEYLINHPEQEVTPEKLASRLQTTKGGILNRFYEAIRILEGRDTNSGKMQSKERSREERDRLAHLVAKIEELGFAPGFSIRETEILKYKHSHPEATTEQIAKTLKISTSTFNRAWAKFKRVYYT